MQEQSGCRGPRHPPVAVSSAVTVSGAVPSAAQHASIMPSAHDAMFRADYDAYGHPV